MNLNLLIAFFLLASILSLYHLENITPAFGSTFNQLQDQNPRIELTANAAPRFFDCGETSSNGTSLLPGQRSIEESAQSALTDRNLDTVIMGKAAFNVFLGTNSPIVNVPGPDLALIEMENPEAINASISEPASGSTRELILKPTPGNATNTNNCQYEVNNLFVDLSSFGVPEGSSIPSIHFDNLGWRGTLVGSDIAEIFLLQPQVNTSSSSPGSTSGELPFFTQN